MPSDTWVLQTLRAKVDGKIISIEKNIRIPRSKTANFICNTEGIQDANINGVPQILEQMQVGIIVDYRTLGTPPSRRFVAVHLEKND